MNKKILSLTTTLLLVLLFASCGMRRCATTFDEGVVINGVRWATRNVDAPGTFAATPESFGMFFQWNRKKAWNATDERVEDWDNAISAGTKWYAENDPSPIGWRIPTRAEIRSLLDSEKVSSEWTTQNNINGRLFTCLDTGNNLFLPAVGHRCGNDGARLSVNVWGLYWNSTLSSRGMAWSLYIGSDNVRENMNFCRVGLSIRAVAK